MPISRVWSEMRDADAIRVDLDLHPTKTLGMSKRLGRQDQSDCQTEQNDFRHRGCANKWRIAATRVRTRDQGQRNPNAALLPFGFRRCGSFKLLHQLITAFEQLFKFFAISFQFGPLFVQRLNLGCERLSLRRLLLSKSCGRCNVIPVIGAENRRRQTLRC